MTPGLSPVTTQTPSDRPHLDFIGGISEGRTYLSGIENTATGKEVFRLTTRLMRPSDAQWDGQYLVADYENEERLILDFNNMLLQ